MIHILQCDQSIDELQFINRLLELLVFRVYFISFTLIKNKFLYYKRYLDHVTRNFTFVCSF